ncbi:MAG: hypothetical protein ACP5KG_07780 [Myxococcota bacterium]
MRRNLFIKFLVIVLALTISLPLSSADKKKGGTQPPKEEELPPLIPLTPIVKEKEKATPQKDYRVIEATKVEALESKKVKSDAKSESGESEKGFWIQTEMALYYDNNVLKFSTQEMVGFSHPEWNPNSIMNDTSAYRIKGYVDFAVSPSVLLGFKKSILSSSPAELRLYGEGSFYLQNNILNRGVFGASIAQGLSERLSLNLGGYYQPQRYYRELISPEPYLNPFSEPVYKTAKYESLFLPLTFNYRINDSIVLFFQYQLASRKFNKDFNYRDTFYQGLGLGGRYSPIKKMDMALDLNGGYASASGDNPSTREVESDPTYSMFGADFSISYDGINRVSLGIISRAEYNIFLTDVEDDLQYYKRKDYFTISQLWFGYQILNELSVVADYSFAYNSTNPDKGGIGINGVNDFERQTIMISLSYGDIKQISSYRRLRSELYWFY